MKARFLRQTYQPITARSRRRWTETEDQQLAAGVAAGKTASQLADDHGRTPVAIRLRVLKLAQYGDIQ